MPVLLQKAFWSFQLYCFNKRPFLLTVLFLLVSWDYHCYKKKKNTINFILTIVFPSHFYPDCSDRQYPFIAISTQYFLSCCRISFGKLPSIHTVFLQFYHHDQKIHLLFLGSPEILYVTLPIRLKTMSFRIHYVFHTVLLPSIINSHNYTTF